eukprot:scaffold401133_cov18-Prasinocladus_malaysianus.AAC.1
MAPKSVIAACGRAFRMLDCYVRSDLAVSVHLDRFSSPLVPVGPAQSIVDICQPPVAVLVLVRAGRGTSKTFSSTRSAILPLARVAIFKLSGYIHCRNVHRSLTFT